MTDDDVKGALSASSARPPIPKQDFLSTGSTLLNLACTGFPTRGLWKGGYFFFVGDTNSGKSWWGMTILAEASINAAFDNHQLVYVNAENGILMDVPRYFGPRLAERLVLDDGGDRSVEGFYDRLDDVLAKGPAVVILDSMDVLVPRAELAHIKKARKAQEKGEKASGSYGMDKPKINSSRLRIAANRVRDTGSVLVVISQTRDRVGMGAMFDPKTRSGGHALTFYAQCEIWTSVLKKLKKEVRGKQRQVGLLSRCRVRRSRVTGKDRTVDVPILHSSGIDDVGACLDFLVDEGFWKKSGGRIRPEGLFECGPTLREALIEAIQEEGVEPKLRKIVGAAWRQIEAECVIPRKNRYG